ncbi:ATP-binding protein [Lentzea sp. NPDC051213]|uniref:ATP-binding protein n=1 Tax=Lentzea sp. NPDC051213 TaxID=3364126 RepID=UPI0037B6AD13
MARLLTLVGPAGVGKTRLALRMTRQLARGFADGIYFIELDSVRDPGLLVSTIATELGLRDLPDEPLGKIVDFLQHKTMLLVLDNCEHLVDACAAVIAGILAGAPGVRVLTTSRQVLGVTGEHLLPVPPLSVPAEGSDADSDAVTLLTHRVAAVDQGFELGPANRAAVAGICRRLDGMPLAIELVAAWFRVLAPQEILEHLDDRFRLLDARTESRPSRQRTLSAALDWSYGLCSPAEKAMWARLSVFSGGFTLAAAEGVGIPAELSDGRRLLELIADLVDKSIIVRDDDRSLARYRMLETVREYGLTKLVQTDAEHRVRLLHRDYFLAMAEDFNPKWMGPRQVEVAAATRRELANLRAALAFSLAHPEEAVTGARLAFLLGSFWTTCGYLGEARRWLDCFIEVPRLPDNIRVEALFVHSFALVALGEREAAVIPAAEAVMVAGCLQNDYLLGVALLAQGGAAFVGDDLARADQIYTKSEELLIRSGRVDLKILMCYSAHAMVVAFAGDVVRAAELARRSIEIADGAGEQWTKSYATYALALAEWQQGHHSEAAKYAGQCIEIKHIFSDTIGLAMAVELLAWIAASADDGERAARLLGAASQIWRYGGGKAMLDSQNWLVPHDNCVEQAKHLLGERRFRAVFTEGQAMSPDVNAAVDVALDREHCVPVPAGTPSAPGDVLTKREYQIAELVADGASNKEIAARLVISPRTVATHVQNIMGKLGFTSRIQVATWITQLRNRT